MARTSSGTIPSTGSRPPVAEELSTLLGILRAFDVIEYEAGGVHIVLDRKRPERTESAGENRPADLNDEDYRYAHVGRKPVNLADLRRGAQ